MFKIVRKLLFLMPPEKAHYFTMNSLSLLSKIPLLSSLFFPKPNKDQKISFCGLQFTNKIGLAAGFDKDARFLDVLAKMGFGHVEVGTVTPLAQEGNPQPRLFRLPKDNALINRMGFNNQGVDAMVERLKNKPSNIIIGGNIGKNKLTPNENATKDYLICFRKLFKYVDYFTVNVSSPNTPGLRELQDKEPLTQLLQELMDERAKLLAKNKIKPILLKIAPDMSEEQIKEVSEVVSSTGIDGIILNNTTLDRNDLKTPPEEIENIGAGGLSGAPMKTKSNDTLRIARKYLPSDFPIIGVGGISNQKDGQERIDTGANLIQIYTGFVYGGIGLVKKLAKI